MPEQMPFSSVFTVHKDGSITTKRSIRVGGILLNEDVHLLKGQSIAGIDFTEYAGHDLGVVIENGVYVIRQIF